MKTSECIDKIAPALVEAQTAMGRLTKNATNPHFGKRYADLAAVCEVALPAFHDQGIMVLQSGEEVDGVFAVTTRLLHSSGQWIEGTTPVYPAKKDPQGIGSAFTYGRRYGLQAMAGLAQEDDDGNAATDGREKQAPTAAAQRQQSRPKQTPAPKTIDPATIGKIRNLIDELELGHDDEAKALQWATQPNKDTAPREGVSKIAHLFEPEASKLIALLEQKLSAKTATTTSSHGQSE